MTQMTKVYGVLGLLCGVVLVAQSTNHLRADPSPSFFTLKCPHEELSEAEEDCALARSCAYHNGDKTNCTKAVTDKLHWEVVAFPKVCLNVDGNKKLCNNFSRECKTFIRCQYSTDTMECFKDTTQPTNPPIEEAYKLIQGDCE